MIEQPARVVGSEDGFAWVREETAPGCNQCGAKGCGIALWAKLLPRKKPPLRVRTRHRYMPGDQVVIGLPEKDLLTGTFLVYGVPMLGMLLFAVIGELVSDSLSLPGDLTALAFGVAGFVASLAIVRRYSRIGAAGGAQNQPVLLRRAENGRQHVQAPETD